MWLPELLADGTTEEDAAAPRCWWAEQLLETIIQTLQSCECFIYTRVFLYFHFAFTIGFIRVLISPLPLSCFDLFHFVLTFFSHISLCCFSNCLMFQLSLYCPAKPSLSRVEVKVTKWKVIKVLSVFTNCLFSVQIEFSFSGFFKPLRTWEMNAASNKCLKAIFSH